MPLLKDTESEQLRQLVKACLLEISKLKFELKKCQKESSSSVDTEVIQKSIKEEYHLQIQKKDAEIVELNTIIKDKDNDVSHYEHENETD